MVSLRDVRDEDETMILGWRNLPEVGKYMYTDATIDPDTHARWFADMMGSSKSRYWVIVCDGKDVGLANVYAIDRVNQRCSWAFYIASTDVRGKGVGSFVEYFVMRYVFEELKLNKLCCEVFDFNTAVIGMHKRFGFSQEGFFREHIRKGDTRYDVVALAMLASEWTEKKSELSQRLRDKGLLPE